MTWIIILLLLFILWTLNSRYSKLGKIIADLVNKKAYKLPDEIILDTVRVPAANQPALIQWFVDKGFNPKRSFQLGSQAHLHLLVREGSDSNLWVDLLTKGEDAMLASAEAKVELDGGQFDDVAFNYQLLFPEQSVPRPKLSDLFKTCKKKTTKSNSRTAPQTDTVQQNNYKTQQAPVRPSTRIQRTDCFQVGSVVFNAIQNAPGISYQGGNNTPDVRIALIDSRASFSAINEVEEVINNSDPYIQYLSDASNDFDGMDFSTVEDHGTFMASLIASSYSASSALKIRNYSFHDGQSGHLMEVICAVLAAADQGVDILNLSLGYVGESADHHLRRAFQFARSKNILIVCAAGNLNSDNDTNGYWPANFSVMDNVITVAAVGATGLLWNETTEVGSNFGLVTVPVAIHAENVPGLVADGSTKTLSGTSCGAAKLSAVAAEIKSQNPGFSAAELKTAVLNQIAPGGPIFPVPGGGMA